MDLNCWRQCVRALEGELCPFFGPAETHRMLRRAGRRVGRAAAEAAGISAGASMDQLAACLGPFPLLPTEGGAILAEDDTTSAEASWCAGVMEGVHPRAASVQMWERDEGGFQLEWSSSDSVADGANEFSIPRNGPLTPFQMSQLADLSADAILFIDTDKRIRAWNRGAEEMFGYSREEAVGRSSDLLIPEDLVAAGELERISAETEAKGTLRNYLTRRRHADGRDLRVSLTRTQVVDRYKALVGFGVILRDVTESEKMKHQLVQAQQLAQIGELASQVAHEVRNPLAGVHGALQVLRRRLRLEKADEQVFVEIAAEIARLDALVTDLLRFGRPVPPRTQPIELSAWLTQWARRVMREPRDGRLEISVHAPDEVDVELDVILTESVLRNLLQNSMEASSEACRIELSLTVDDRQARIVFRDDGPGIPADLQDLALQPFFTTKTRGSGLGLPICARLLHAQGGSIEILPTSRGAAVEVTLPRALENTA